MIIKENFSLKNYNTFGIDVRCDFFTEVDTVDDLNRIIKDDRFYNIPKMILGGGSNILFTQDFKGLIIRNSIKGIRVVKENEDHVWLKAGAGEVWHDLVMYAIAHHWGGIENLSLIPGLVGAAPMQNIGAYGVELESVFDSLEAINMQTGELEIFDKAACRFGYRESVFKNELKGKYCIVSVTLRLNKKPVLNLSYGAIRETLQNMHVIKPDIKSVSDAVIAIRTSKLPDPGVLGNAGSFFKNPEITEEQFKILQEKYPAIPAFAASDNLVKISAAWLIEQCGWKGKRVGDAGTHAQHALVLVNYGNALGAEIKQLADKIQQSVLEKFGICLTPEVNIV
jgi:UDP-N-acetylmuramate dehydrogenase